MADIHAREVRLSVNKNWYVRFHAIKVNHGRYGRYEWRQPFSSSLNTMAVESWAKVNEIEIEVRPELVLFKNKEDALLCYLFFA